MRDDEGAPVSRRDLLKGAAAGGLALAAGSAAAAAERANAAAPAKPAPSPVPTPSRPLPAAPAPGTAAPTAAAAAGQAPAAGEAAGTPPAQTVTGIVFEDRAGDGLRKPDSPGLAGILVSNGAEVVATDAEGRYTLPVSDETIIFVIKPAGFMTLLDPATMLPQFYHIHQPKGTPPELGLTFAGIAPTGPLPASVDFALRRQDEPAAFDVVLFTDPQPESDVELDFVREDMMSVIGSTQARFGITVGDMLFDDLSMYPRYNHIIGALGLPWYNVGGNHDLNFEAPDRHYARETFKRVFGPPYYAFAYGQAVFILLDDVDYLGLDRAKPNGSGRYEGRLDARQLTFVRNLLAQVPNDRLVVIATHIPLRTYLDDQPYQNLTNRDALLALLQGRPHTLSVSGHTHTTEHHYLDLPSASPDAVPHHHHVLTALSGSWWSGPFDHRGVAVADSRDGTPNGFHILSVDGTRTKTRFIPAKEPDARQIRVSIHAHAHDEMRRDFRPGALLQPRLSRDAAAAALLVVNVFDGGPRTEVHLQVGPAALALQRRAIPDPFVEDVFARNDATRKPWVKAEVSSHIWTVRLPALEPGAHHLVITAVTEYGDTATARLVLEVEG